MTGVEHLYGQALEAIAVMNAQNAKLSAVVKEQAAEIERLRSQNTLHVNRARGEYWAWQGDGTDDLPSLTCPVLIPAKTLEVFVTKAGWHDELAQRIQQMRV